MKVFLVGDLILDEPNPDLLFDDVRGILKTADVLVGQVEVPHTNRGKDSHFDIPAPPAKIEHLDAIKNAGFHGITLAGNHFFDAGNDGVEDTINKLHSLNIKTSGAGSANSWYFRKGRYKNWLFELKLCRTKKIVVKRKKSRCGIC